MKCAVGTKIHYKILKVQLVNYLVATKIDNGLLINFSEDGVEVKRKFREFNKKKYPVDSEDPVILSK